MLYAAGAGNRVAITGVGMVSPLGLDAESSWQGLKSGVNGISHRACEGRRPRQRTTALDEPAVERSRNAPI